MHQTRYKRELDVPRVGILSQGFYAKSYICDACDQWYSEDWPVWFYKVADLYICQDCHDDYVAGIDHLDKTNKQ